MHNGSPHTVELTATNAAYTLSGQTQTDVGDYNATVTLNDTSNYEWVDGTTTPLNLPWSINPNFFAFYGIWKDDEDYEIVITANTFEFRYEGSLIFKLNNLTFTSYPNTDPTTIAVGYITGTKKTGILIDGDPDYFPYGPDGKQHSLYDTVVLYHYIHDNGNTLIMGDVLVPPHHGDIDFIYTKAP